MTFRPYEDLRDMTKIYVNEWTILKVDDEVLLPGAADGTKWWSRWDNWLLAPDVGSIEPLIMINNMVIDPYASPPLYTMETGESVRTRVDLTNAPANGANAIVLATYRRNLFTDTFWSNNLRGAASEIGTRVLLGNLDYTQLDDVTSPWGIIVKQAGRNALANVQTMLAGLAKTQIEGMTLDLSRSALGLADTLNQLGDEIDRDVVSYRHTNSPGPRAIWPVRPVPGPFINGLGGVRSLSTY